MLSNNNIIKTPSRNQTTQNNDPEHKLEYVLTTLGLKYLIPLFHSKNCTLTELVLMTKEDFIRMNLDLCSRNRIISFLKEYNKIAKIYCLKELLEFMDNHPQYIFTNNQIKQYENSNNQKNDKDLISTGKFCNANRIMKDVSSNQIKQVNNYQKEEKKTNKPLNNIIKPQSIPNKITSYRSVHSTNSQPKLVNVKVQHYKKAYHKYNNSFVNTYLSINQHIDCFLEVLKKSKEERTTKYAKYNTLIQNKSIRCKTRHLSQDNNHMSSIKNIKRSLEFEEIQSVKDVIQSKSTLNEIRRVKKTLKQNLHECNKSIDDNKKLLICLDDDKQNENQGIILDNNNNNGNDITMKNFKVLSDQQNDYISKCNNDTIPENTIEYQSNEIDNENVNPKNKLNNTS